MQHNKPAILKLNFKTARLIFVLLLVAHILPSTSSALIGIKEGDAPKEIVLNDLQNRTVRVSEYFGKKPVVLIFWEQPLSSAFLDYSMDALRFLSDYYDTYRDKTGLEIFGVYTPVEDGVIPDDEITRVRNLIRKNKITFPILIDRGFKFFQEYGVIALPSTVMVNKTGKVQFIYPSFPLSARPLIAEQVKILMGMAEPAKKQEVVKGPDSQSVRYYRYALQLYKKGLAEQTLSPLKKSLELDPDLARAHNLMGVCLWEGGKSNEAHGAFVKAIKLDRDNTAARLNYAVMLIEQQQYAEAEKNLKSLSIADAPLKVRMHYLLGMVYRNTNRIDEAIQELEEANNIIDNMESEERGASSFSDSYRIFLLHDLSELYNKKNNKDKAIELLNRAVRVSINLEGTSGPIPLHNRKDMMLYE